jgi:CBS domain-containing protein
LFLVEMAKVKDLMTKNVITIDAQKTVFEAAQLMSDKGVGDLVVCEDNSPKGIVTERDFVRRVVAKRRPLDTKVSEIMSQPLITIDPDALVKVAAREMANNRIRRLPVLSENELVGIIAASDFARHLGKKTFTEGLLEAIWRYPMTEPSSDDRHR